MTWGQEYDMQCEKQSALGMQVFLNIHSSQPVWSRRSMWLSLYRSPVSAAHVGAELCPTDCNSQGLGGLMLTTVESAAGRGTLVAVALEGLWRQHFLGLTVVKRKDPDF